MNNIAPRRRAGGLLVAAILCIPALAAGQVMRRQTGQALDANYQVGSGGFNTVYGGVGGVNSQLYITGQVTGLRRFRGAVPYYAADQLRLNVPSASLSDFRRQSIGVGNVLGGVSYMPAPYYERTATAFGVGGITSGRTAAGTNIPRSRGMSRRLAQELYVDATADYRPLMGRVNRIIPMVPVPARAAGSTQEQLPRMLDLRVPPAERAEAAAIFGVLRAKDRQELARELYEMRQDSERRVDTRVASQVENLVEKTVDRPGRRERPSRQQLPERPEKEPVPPKDTKPKSPAPLVPEAGEDAFIDLMLLLRQQRKDQSGQGEEPAGAMPQSSQERALDLARRERGIDPTAQTPQVGSGRLVALSGPKKDIVIHALAGRSRDMFNTYMAQAQEKLKAGKFYEAAEGYNMAVLVNPRNPLARMGVCLSLFAAGEPFSAAFNLRQAVELFPPVMETRLDVAAMMPVGVFKSRLAALDVRLSGEADFDKSLIFLASFLHLSISEEAEAKAYARKLNAAAQSDKLYGAYVEFVFSGKRPAQKAAPTGASTPKGTSGP